MLIEGWSYSRHVAGARDPAVSINKTDKCPALMNLVKKTGNDQIKCMGGQTDGKRERETERGQILCRKLNMVVESTYRWEIYYLRQVDGHRRCPVTWNSDGESRGHMQRPEADSSE